jgi:hypothetical protein
MHMEAELTFRSVTLSNFLLNYPTLFFRSEEEAVSAHIT